jgi:hypothetical protein
MAAEILLAFQILAAIAGADWSLVQIIETIKKDGGLAAIHRNVLEILRGQATPPTLDQLKLANPDLHAQAVALLGAQGGVL